MSAYVQQITCIRVIKVALFIIVNNGQKAKFLTWYIHTMENYTAIKNYYYRPQK